MSTIEVITRDKLRDMLALKPIRRGLLAWDPIKENFELFEHRLKKKSTMICLHPATQTVFFLQSALANRYLGQFDYFQDAGSLMPDAMDDFAAFCRNLFGIRALLWIEPRPAQGAMEELQRNGFERLGSLPEMLFSEGCYHAQSFLYKSYEVLP